MSYVYIIEWRQPKDKKGEWQLLAICETEDIAINRWPGYPDSPRKWYKSHGKLYCRTYNSGGEPVICRIRSKLFYTEAWFQSYKRDVS